MKVYAPDYYGEFSCIADKCRHSCCIGWEIDVDAETHNYYKSVGGDFSLRLKNEISTSGDIAHFILGKDERCPFLNENNLCDIILELGEDKLCQICSDHPRYRNFFDSRIEIGLGLCCEAAGKLILKRRNKTKLVVIEDDNISENENDEDAFFDFRDKIYNILQDRSQPIDERIKLVGENYGAIIPERTPREWADIFLGLERLDSSWEDALNKLKSFNGIFTYDAKKMDTVFEQLIIYFITRHLADGLYDGLLCERIEFAFLSHYVIKMLWQISGDTSLDGYIDMARRYSCEIEYSEENISALLEVLANA